MEIQDLLRNQLGVGVDIIGDGLMYCRCSLAVFKHPVAVRRIMPSKGVAMKGPNNKELIEHVFFPRNAVPPDPTCARRLL